MNEELKIRIDTLEAEIKAIRECIDVKTAVDALLEMGRPALRVRVPDENTPEKTIIRFVPDGPLFFWRGDGRFSASAFGDGVSTDRPCFIDTNADLRFRMFLNAPDEYKWGAIDKDGTGYVFDALPAVEEWDAAWASEGFCQEVGLFPQYADEWDKILIEREA